MDRLKLLAGAASASLAALSLGQADIRWNVPSGSWHTGENWVGGQVPSEGQRAAISNGGRANLTADAMIGRLVVGSNDAGGGALDVMNAALDVVTDLEVRFGRMSAQAARLTVLKRLSVKGGYSGREGALELTACDVEADTLQIGGSAAGTLLLDGGANRVHARLLRSLEGGLLEFRARPDGASGVVTDRAVEMSAHGLRVAVTDAGAPAGSFELLRAASIDAAGLDVTLPPSGWTWELVSDDGGMALLAHHAVPTPGALAFAAVGAVVAARAARLRPLSR